MMAIAASTKQAALRLGVFMWSAVAAAAVFMWMTSVIPSVEAIKWPVIKDIKIQVTAHSLEENQVNFDISFTKARDCRFVSLTWQVFGPDGTMNPAIINMKSQGGQGRRGTGRYEIKGLNLKVSDGTEMNDHIATWRHECHGLWQTETEARFKSWFK